MAITQHTILHDGPGGPFESVAVYDDAAGSQPGLLLFPNFFGLKEWDIDKAHALAMQGYKVLAVDYYGKGKRGTDMESSGALMQEFTADRAAMRDRLLDALGELKKLPGDPPQLADLLALLPAEGAGLTLQALRDADDARIETQLLTVSLRLGAAALQLAEEIGLRYFTLAQGHDHAV